MLAYVLFQKQKEKQQQRQQRERLKQEHNSGCCNTTSMQGWHVFFLVVNDCQQKHQAIIVFSCQRQRTQSIANQPQDSAAVTAFNAQLM
mmetsp:Transcript_135893/g.271107  ORF Transcript_135893/g.271107 Transcript_135893/m.271107 type:complete len:89 (+) Transcript_135893:49-315(+)